MPGGGYRREEKENATQKQEGAGSSSSLNDVKNRLVIMQKNKEELEEKLKAYEVRMKSHFNRWF